MTLKARLGELEETVETLQETVERKDERIDALESMIEFRGDSNGLTDLWIGNNPVGILLDNTKQDLSSLETRVSKLERGEVDPSEVVVNSAGPDIEELVPIHQMYLTATRTPHHQHNLASNQEIAARLFPEIVPAATPEGNERLRITSPKVKQLIEKEVCTPELAKRLDVENPNRNTVARVMKHIGKFGAEILEFKPAKDTGRKANEIVIDRDAWIEYKEILTGTSQELTYDESDVDGETGQPGQADQAFDRVQSAQPVETDGGDVTVS